MEYILATALMKTIHKTHTDFTLLMNTHNSSPSTNLASIFLMYNLAKTRTTVYINSKGLPYFQGGVVIHNLLTIDCLIPNGVLLIRKQFDCGHSTAVLKAKHMNR